MGYVVSCVIVVISGLIGFIVANEYVKKYKFYKQLYEFVQYLKINIGFTRETLKNNFKSFRGEDWFNNWLSGVMEYIENKDKGLSLPLKMSIEEQQEITNFVQGLGGMDCSSQQSFLNTYMEIFKNRLAKSEELKNKNYNVYSRLGIGIGLIIAIVIV